MVRMAETAAWKSAPSRSILLTKASLGTPWISACRHTVSDCGCTPATAQNTPTRHPNPQGTSTSMVKSTCPGVDMLIRFPRHGQVVQASDGDAALLLLGHEVHGGRAVMHLPHAMNLSGIIQDALGQGGLSGIDVGDDPDVADQGQAAFLPPLLGTHRYPLRSGPATTKARRVSRKSVTESPGKVQKHSIRGPTPGRPKGASSAPHLATGTKTASYPHPKKRQNRLPCRAPRGSPEIFPTPHPAPGWAKTRAERSKVRTRIAKRQGSPEGHRTSRTPQGVTAFQNPPRHRGAF
jgi:hypothetical protein